MTDKPKDFEKVLDKLLKLMKHRDSAEQIGSEAEAQAFAARVAEMLAKHRLEEADVHDHFNWKEAEARRVGSSRADFREHGMPYYHRRIGWTERLGRVIADHYFCRMLVNPGENVLTFAGRQMDREVAVFVYITLARAALKMSEKLQRVKELVRYITEEPLDLRNFRESFYEGFVDGIRDRLKLLQKEMNENPQMAIVLAKSEEELDLWMNNNSVKVHGGPGLSDLRNDLAYEAGKSYANDVTIQTGVRGKGPPKLIE